MKFVYLISSLFMTCALSAGAQEGIYQFKDPGFEENWTTGDRGGHSLTEPGNGWHSFLSAENHIKLTGIVTIPMGDAAVFGSVSKTEKVEGYNSNGAVQLTSVSGIKNANGNLTTGKIYMGSMTPNDPLNYNYSDVTSEDASLNFAGIPDAVTFMAKFTAGKDNKQGVARGRFILHDKYNYKDPEENFPEEESHRITRAEQLISKSENWLPYSAKFEYPDNFNLNSLPDERYLLASFTTNPEPGESSGDILCIDDVKFVYYSDLKSLSYDGTPINIEDTKNIQIAAKDFDLSKVSCTSGKGADIQKKYDPSTHTLTITIYGNDYSVNNNNKNTYSVKIVPSISEVESTYNRWVTVTLSQKELSIIGSESLNDIVISGDENGKAVFSLTGFTFPGFGDMGTVVIKDGNLNYEADGSISIEATNPAVPIEGLGGMPVPVVLKGNLKDGKLTADVQIDLMETFGMNVSVHVDDVPFKISGANGILTVTGNIASAYGAAYVGESKANVIDLTGATLATGLNSSNFSAEANNTLYKISKDQILAGNNVIQNGTCKTLVLTDGLTFNAPEGFEAAKVTFNRKFTAGQLSTVVLPFSFETANVNGTVYKLESVENGVLSFKSVEGKADANVPYLVQTEGDNLFNGTLTNAIVAQTPETVENSIAGTGVTHVGNFGETMTITSDGQTSWYGYNKNGSFVKVLSGTVKPFRSAIKSKGAAPSSFALKLDGTVTGIVNLENPNAKVDVYTVSGVCVRKNVPAASALNGLSRGVYIVGGQKVVK